MRTISARLKDVEGVNPTTSAKVPASAVPGGLQRILNPPKSPSYVGPTSAEFGLDPQDASALYNHDDDDDGTNRFDTREDQETHHASPAVQSSVASAPTEKPVGRDPLSDLGLEETLRLVQVYEDTVGVMYPCVDLASLRTYIVEFYHSRSSTLKCSPARSPARSDQDWFHARDIHVLRILLATALLVETHGRSEQAAQLADSVEDRFASRLKVASVDMKECLILTLLVSQAPLFINKL